MKFQKFAKFALKIGGFKIGWEKLERLSITNFVTNYTSKVNFSKGINVKMLLDTPNVPQSYNFLRTGRIRDA